MKILEIKNAQYFYHVLHIFLKELIFISKRREIKTSEKHM